MPFKIIQHQEEILKREKALEAYGSGGRVRVCLAYPNTYFTGMSSLGFQEIFHRAASTPDVFCDRTFLPAPGILPLFEKSTRTLMGWKSEIPLQEFHCLAFSISFEPDYLNVLRMLELSGIPLLCAGRDGRHPLVIAGGAAVTINPEPLAPFVDLFVIGPGEGVIEPLLDLLKNEGCAGREALLQKAGAMPGVYVPSLHPAPPGSSMESSPPGSGPGSFSHSRIITPDTEFSGTFLVEISRGCPFHCTFCCVGRLCPAHRPAPLKSIVEAIQRGMAHTRKVGLLGAAVASHPDLSKILDCLEERGATVSFASLRADVLDLQTLERLRLLGQGLLTLAPETGSDLLRKSLGKGMTGLAVLNTVENAVKAGFRDVRLYFMVGLPGEGEKDALKAAGLVGEVAARLRPVGGGLMVSVNQFVPKPGTPLQSAPLEREEVVAERIRLMQKPFLKDPMVKFKTEAGKDVLLQAYLSGGDKLAGLRMLDFYRKSPSGAAVHIRKLRKKGLQAGAGQTLHHTPGFLL